MAVEIRVPTLGESIVDAVIVKWLKQPGETVARSEPIVELETDKVNVEVPADQAGVIASIARNEGDTVAVGEVLGTIDPCRSASAAPAPAAGAEFTPAQPDQHPEVPAAEAAPATAESAADAARRAGPAVRRLAAERAVDLAAVTGSGPGGRIRPEDVNTLPVPPQPRSHQRPHRRQPRHRRPSRPSASRAVAQWPVRPRRARPDVAPPADDRPPAGRGAADGRDADDLQRGRHDARSWRCASGAATPSRSATASASASCRSSPRRSIGALKAFPRVNAEIQGDEIVLQALLRHRHRRRRRGGAGRPGRPRRRPQDLRRDRAGDRRAGDEGPRRTSSRCRDLQGGTFTITNGGIFGSLLSTPILNPPQVGILGMHKIQERPVVVQRRGRHPPDDVPGALLRPPHRRRPRSRPVPRPHQGTDRRPDVAADRSVTTPASPPRP